MDECHPCQVQRNTICISICICNELGCIVTQGSHFAYKITGLQLNAFPPININPNVKKIIFIILLSNCFGSGFAGALASDLKTTPAEVVDLHRIFRMPVGNQGLEFDDEFKKLDHKIVKMTGFMVKSDEPEPGSFLLAVRPIQLNEHADGEANDLPPSTVSVLLDPAQSDNLVPYQQGLQTFQGILLLGRFESSEKSISWIRLQLPMIKP